MKTIKDQINKTTIDSHIHLFDHSETLYNIYEIPKRFTKMVCFSDIRFADEDEYRDMLPIYDKFIEEKYDKEKHILLATGLTSQSAIEVHKKYPEIIRGFGEFKLYDRHTRYDGKVTPLKHHNLDILDGLLEYNEQFKLPIYVHFNLYNETDFDEFESKLRKYPSQPIVLCHFGMIEGNEDKNKYISSKLKSLHKKYSNLWFDLSYTAIDYFLKNRLELLGFDVARIILGSDLNPVIKSLHQKKKEAGIKIIPYREYIQNEYNKVKDIGNLYPFDKNTKKLFNIQ